MYYITKEYLRFELYRIRCLITYVIHNMLQKSRPDHIAWITSKRRTWVVFWPMHLTIFIDRTVFRLVSLRIRGRAYLFFIGIVMINFTSYFCLLSFSSFRYHSNTVYDRNPCCAYMWYSNVKPQQFQLLLLLPN